MRTGTEVKPDGRITVCTQLRRCSTLSWHSLHTSILTFEREVPTFPMDSPFFKGRIMAINDARFKHPLSWRLPYELTFYTHQYYEGRDHSFGFQYLLFLPVSILLLPFVSSVLARRIVVLGLCAPLLIATFLSNARYFYPTMPFMSLSGAVIWAATKRTSRVLHAVFCFSIIA